VQNWNELPADERKLYARMMEVFAGFCEHMDHHVGRLIDFLEALGELDNTLIMMISDNGASSEGGPTGSVNENKFVNNVPDDLKQNLAALEDLGGQSTSITTRGAGRMRATSPSSAGNERPIVAASPIPSWCKEVGRVRIENTVAGRFGIDTFGIGSDTGSPVTGTYKPPFPFSGTIERVDIELGPQNLSAEDETKLREMYTAFAGSHE
jgi:hypothetical protein